jgi:tRNA A-37 threonylcarbamoyl transferase component Bud32
MPDFTPRPNEPFETVIDNHRALFQVVEHPNAPGVTHSMKAGKATVYHLKDVDSGEEYALKVMKHRYRVPSLEEVCRQLDALKTLPGLMVCERRCLSPTSAPLTLQQYENLTYAILMPWMQGKSWFDFMQIGKRDGATMSQQRSLLLACNFARILARLEHQGIAHCDLSPANMILNERTLQAELIDVEDIYGPGFAQPDFISKGTECYQHHTSQAGQWGPDVDRFAAAILISEILGWYDPDVVAASAEESYFDSAELQTDNCGRLETLSWAVARHGAAAAELLEHAWGSDTFAECPTLNDWAQTLDDIKDAGVWKKVARPPAQTQLDPQSVWKETVAPPVQYAPFWVAAPEASAAPVNASPATWSGQTPAANAPQDSPARWNESAYAPNAQQPGGGAGWIDTVAAPDPGDQ